MHLEFQADFNTMLWNTLFWLVN